MSLCLERWRNLYSVTKFGLSRKRLLASKKSDWLNWAAIDGDWAQGFDFWLVPNRLRWMLVRQSTGANVFVMKSDLICLAACVAFRTRHRSWNLIRAIAKGRSCLAEVRIRRWIQWWFRRWTQQSTRALGFERLESRNTWLFERDSRETNRRTWPRCWPSSSIMFACLCSSRRLSLEQTGNWWTVIIHPLGSSLRLDAVQRSTESTRLSVKSLLLMVILDYDLFRRGEVWKPFLPKRQV